MPCRRAARSSCALPTGAAVPDARASGLRAVHREFGAARRGYTWSSASDRRPRNDPAPSGSGAGVAWGGRPGAAGASRSAVRTRGRRARRRCGWHLSGFRSSRRGDRFRAGSETIGCGVAIRSGYGDAEPEPDPDRDFGTAASYPDRGADGGGNAYIDPRTHACIHACSHACIAADVCRGRRRHPGLDRAGFRHDGR